MAVRACSGLSLRRCAVTEPLCWCRSQPAQGARTRRSLGSETARVELGALPSGKPRLRDGTEQRPCDEWSVRRYVCAPYCSSGQVGRGVGMGAACDTSYACQTTRHDSPAHHCTGRRRWRNAVVYSTILLHQPHDEIRYHVATRRPMRSTRQLNSKAVYLVRFRVSST